MIKKLANVMLYVEDIDMGVDFWTNKWWIRTIRVKDTAERLWRK